VWEGRPRDDRDLAWHLDTLTVLFTAALDYAGDTLDAIVCEPHPFTVGFTRGGLSDLCEAVGTGRFGLILDTCHLSVAFPEDYLAQLRPLVPCVKHLHLADSDLETSELHYPPGAGLVDLAACMRTLHEEGFRGTVAWDLYSWPFPERAVRETRPALSRLVAMLEAGAPSDAPRSKSP
jgi:sugar phosphate isomerase/epimerase